MEPLALLMLVFYWVYWVSAITAGIVLAHLLIRRVVGASKARK